MNYYQTFLPIKRPSTYLMLTPGEFAQWLLLAAVIGASLGSLIVCSFIA